MLSLTRNTIMCLAFAFAPRERSDLYFGECHPTLSTDKTALFIKRKMIQAPIERMKRRGEGQMYSLRMHPLAFTPPVRAPSLALLLRAYKETPSLSLSQFSLLSDSSTVMHPLPTVQEH